jgi:cytoskeletal protein CcmA (bactofilin family)/nicotinamidase-related amidase
LSQSTASNTFLPASNRTVVDMDAPPVPNRKQSLNPSRLPRLAGKNGVEAHVHPVLSQSPLSESKDELSNGNFGSNKGNAMVSHNGSTPYKPRGVLAAQRRARRERDADLPVFKSGLDLLNETPDMVISESVKFQGDLKFEKLVRIDGTVTGHVHAPRNAGLIVGETGTLIGSVRGLGVVLVEGKVIGNINAESMTLMDTGSVHGDIACRSVDIKPRSVISGQLHISAFDPFAALDAETGQIIPTKKSSKFFGEEEGAIIEDDEDAIAAAIKAEQMVADHEDWEDDEETPPSRVSLFIIDPQTDFHSSGTCPVPNADEDAEMIAEFIMQNIRIIDEIYVTLDSHHRMHIAHAIFWENEAGEQPPLYTVIVAADVEEGRWRPRDHSLTGHCKYYLRELESNGKGLQLVIKPEHCLIGSLGHTVVPVINDALQDWAESRMRKVAYMYKGTNCITDMTSALSADMEIPDDPTTGIDGMLMQRLEFNTKLLVCGQSLSHAVNFTMRDLLSRWQKDPSRICILNDCTSENPDLAPAFDSDKFYREMQKAGVTVVPSYEALLEEKKRRKKEEKNKKSKKNKKKKSKD